ncbi:MAG: hypothetical protein DMG66_06540, partial [Acidobacteria bacterium]
MSVPALEVVDHVAGIQSGFTAQPIVLYSELGSKWQYVDDGKFLTPTYACRILLLAGHALPRIAAGP